MKKLLASTALCLISFAASAADLPTAKGPAPAPYIAPPVFTWNGFYVGLNGGGGWASYKRDGLYDSNPVSDSHTQHGYFFGGQVGYNYQISTNWLVGIEADFQGSQFKHVQTCGAGYDSEGCYDNSSVATYNVNWFGTVRGRIGFLAAPNWLVYGTGGFAYGQVQYGALDYLPDNSATQSKVATGWTLGAGTEYAINPSWSIKAEYLYIDLGKRHFEPIATDLVNYGVDIKTRMNVFRVGVNYHF